MIAYDSLKVVAIASLLGWHAWIISKGITTYQYLTEKSLLKEIKRELD